MEFPDKEFLESFEFHEKFYGYDDVRVFSIANITPVKIDFDLQTECRKSLSPVWLYSRIFDNEVVIDDIQSRTENYGNATALFLDFLRCIIAINSQYPISKLCGFLSSFDFDHWDKLIHFYSKMNNHIIPQPDLPITLDFRLRDYTVDYLLANMSEHKNENIDFDIFINYY